MFGSGGFTNPEKILDSLNIKPGFKIADFGSGSGYFTLILARMVGEDGLVTAVDVLETALNTIKSRALLQGLFNIAYTRGNLEVMGGSQLKDNSQDMILLANILFQSQKKEDIIKEAYRALKSGGDLVAIDWLPDSVFGPKETGWKLSAEAVTRAFVSDTTAPVPSFIRITSPDKSKTVGLRPAV